MTIDKWAWECSGKAPADRPGTRGLHHWKRREDRTAYCLRCGEELTSEEAQECFTQR